MKAFLKSLTISVFSGIVVGTGVALLTGNYNQGSPLAYLFGGGTAGGVLATKVITAGKG